MSTIRGNLNQQLKETQEACKRSCLQGCVGSFFLFSDNNLFVRSTLKSMTNKA